MGDKDADAHLRLTPPALTMDPVLRFVLAVCCVCLWVG